MVNYTLLNEILDYLFIFGFAFLCLFIGLWKDVIYIWLPSSFAIVGLLYCVIMKDSDVDD